MWVDAVETDDVTTPRLSVFDPKAIVFAEAVAALVPIATELANVAWAPVPIAIELLTPAPDEESEFTPIAIEFAPCAIAFEPIAIVPPWITPFWVPAAKTPIAIFPTPDLVISLYTVGAPS